jgi:two-component system LytT family sensor kinase
VRLCYEPAASCRESVGERNETDHRYADSGRKIAGLRKDPDMVGVMSDSTKTQRALLPLGLLLLWTAVGLFFATAGGRVAQSLALWYLWGLLAWAMVLVDRRLPVPQERLGVRVLCHVPLSLVFALVYLWLSMQINVAFFLPAPRPPEWGFLDAIRHGGVQWHLPNYWLILGAYFAFNYHREGQERRRRVEHMESLLTEARLSALRAQLQPHFLFNALNTVSAYVETHPQRARAMLGHVGDLLRFSLDSEDRHEVSLGEELDALNHYLEIQRARFASRLRIQVEVPPGLLDARVPGLLLQPLVENAITHGVAGLPEGGEIRVSAWEHGSDLALRVADNGAGLRNGWSLEHDAGIGLANTRNRLAETYGPTHHFSIAPAAGGGVVVEIRIPTTFCASGDGGGDLGKAARAHRR